MNFDLPMIIYNSPLLVSRALFKRNRKLANFGGFIKPASRRGGGFKRGMNPSPASKKEVNKSLNPKPLGNLQAQA